MNDTNLLLKWVFRDLRTPRGLLHHSGGSCHADRWSGGRHTNV